MTPCRKDEKGRTSTSPARYQIALATSCHRVPLIRTRFCPPAVQAGSPNQIGAVTTRSAEYLHHTPGLMLRIAYHLIHELFKILCLTLLNLQLK